MFLYIGVSSTSAQQNIQFNIRYKGNALLLDSVYHSANGDVVEINVLKFYISSMRFLFVDGSEFTEPNSYHLIDASNPESLVLHFNKAPIGIIKSVSFNLGIDSLTNVSGAMGGDLDPTKGMYWTWQNGYINCKLEGKSNQCLNPKHEFQFHLGGYQNPFASLQKIALTFNQSGVININVNLEEFLGNIDLKKNSEVVTPDAVSVELSEKLARAFNINLK